MVVLLAGERVLKVDSHTHILPSEIPERFPQPLKLIQYEKATEKGFKARLEFKEIEKLFRELKPNCFDAEEVLRQCDSCGRCALLAPCPSCSTTICRLSMRPVD